MQNQQMNQQQQQQQPMMAQPPRVITTKDLLYINDMLAWNLLAAKKAHHAASFCQDIQIKQQLEACGNMHHRHYMKLLSHLEEKQQQNFPSQ